ncbi:MAG TPA: protealysin inhibitor emfourin [Anaerolineales bacterium]|nr:protealysin inhibitor emfourin [Anaerolineales bacterium]
MTTITFERSGGVVGNDLHLDLDLDTLAEDEAQHLLKLIDEADFFNIPEQSTEQFTPDEFKYKIAVDAGQTSHTVYTSDSTIPKNLLPLAKELTMLKILHQ